MDEYDKLVNKEAKLAVIGLGYVGLPIALEFARTIKVVGFDINAERVDMMKNNIDPSSEVSWAMACSSSTVTPESGPNDNSNVAICFAHTLCMT